MAVAAEGIAAVLMTSLGAEAQRLLQIAEARARAGDRTMRVRRPFDHRAVIEANIRVTKHGGKHEPIGRCPMSGVAVGHNRTGRQSCSDPCKLILRAQAVGCRIVEAGAVDIDRAWDVSIGLEGRGLFLAVEIARRPCVNERGVLVVLDLGKLRLPALVEMGGEYFWSRNHRTGLNRMARGLPRGETAIKNRNRRMPGHLQRPVDPG